MASSRPPVTGNRHIVSTGHYLASQAAFQILEAGGNAVDAGVAGGIALGVLQSDLVNVAGVAPILIHDAGTGQTHSIAGLGHWPKAASLELFLDRWGCIPQGLPRSIVPGAPEAWITALEKFGTMTFGETAAAATRFAREGFTMYELMSRSIANRAEGYARWQQNADIYLPGGVPPKAGELFVQTDLAATLQYMADQEAAASGDRLAGLGAARDAFYRGDIASKIVKYCAENDGLLTAEDLAGYRSEVSPALVVKIGGLEVQVCGPWCQGPSFAQMLRILEGDDLGALGHNSPDYAHLLIEAIKLAFADREAYYTDPRFGKTPLDILLSNEYGESRRAEIDMNRAISGATPPGDVSGFAPVDGKGPVSGDIPGPSYDTSYLCVIDRDGNVFSATPSDVSNTAPVIPGTGVVVSSRGSQGWAVEGHPAAIAPGKRPRLTPNPAIVVRPGEYIMPLGTPGGDVQCQAMLQTLMNTDVFGMNLQEAIEAPRFATYSFPDSFEPHESFPDRLMVEDGIDKSVRDALAERGHAVAVWENWTWLAGGMCAAKKDLKTGMLEAGADPRRVCYAVGW